MGGEVAQCFQEVPEMLSYSIICIVGGGISPKRKRGLQCRLITVEDLEGGSNTGPRSCLYDLVT